MPPQSPPPPTCDSDLSLPAVNHSNVTCSIQSRVSNPGFGQGVTEVLGPSSVSPCSDPSGRTHACNGWQLVAGSGKDSEDGQVKMVQVIEGCPVDSTSLKDSIKPINDAGKYSIKQCLSFADILFKTNNYLISRITFYFNIHQD